MNNGSHDGGNTIEGAEACLHALRKIEAMVAQSSVDYFDERALIVATLTNAAEPLSCYMSGFLRTIAEYIDLSLSCGQPAPKNWKPEAAMLKQELANSRAMSYANLPF